jgi:carboxyl-terminal processing protease
MKPDGCNKAYSSRCVRRSLRVAPLALLLALACGSKTSPGSARSMATASELATGNEPAVNLHIEDGLPELPRDPREEVLAQSVAELLVEEHVRNQALDDKVSKEAFPKFLEELDGSKLFLLAGQVEKLRVYEMTIDDQLKSGDLVLARKGAAVLKERRQVVAKLVAELLAAPFDFEQDEEVETDPKKVEYAVDDAAQRERWRKVLKLQVLERIEQLEEVEAALKKPVADGKTPPKKPAIPIPPTFAGKEEQARKELATRFQTRFVRSTETPALEPLERLLNAVASVYDPHTQYLAPSEKENFDIHMSGSLEGIGASLGEEDHYIAVRELVPGGASWTQGKLEAGDLIMAVAQQGQPAVDVIDMPIDKVVRMVRGPKGTVVTLTVKKPDGRVEDISITRDVVRIEASYARGATLKLSPKEAPVGYIHLPGFYGDTRGSKDDRNAADDVLLLAADFERQKVDSLILDLRGNGGGILGAARDITGLFIDSGPVVQTRTSSGQKEVLSDIVKGAAYSGNVVVLVDQFSASASEIVAGALQDYKRAVIVGTGPTHGKGSVQALVDLDRILKPDASSPLGVVKLTTQQYFRVTGDSTQWRGVTPDILLPDPTEFLESQERFIDHSIPWSRTEAVPMVSEKREENLPLLIEKSKSRQVAEPAFSKIDLFNKTIKAQREDTKYSLKLATWRAERKLAQDALDAARPKETDEKPRFEIVLSQPRGLPPATPPGRPDARDKWREDLARDAWVQETLRIVDDMRKN